MVIRSSEWYSYIDIIHLGRRIRGYDWQVRVIPIASIYTPAMRDQYLDWLCMKVNEVLVELRRKTGESIRFWTVPEEGGIHLTIPGEYLPFLVKNLDPTLYLVEVSPIAQLFPF